MMNICNIRWAEHGGYDTTWHDSVARVVEVTGKSPWGETGFATVTVCNGVEAVRLSSVSLFDLFGCRECCEMYGSEDHEKIGHLTEKLIICAEGELPEKLKDQPAGWGLMAAADAAMARYLAASRNGADDADSSMEEFRKSYLHKKVYECLEPGAYELPDCVDCRGRCTECFEDPEPTNGLGPFRTLREMLADDEPAEDSDTEEDDVLDWVDDWSDSLNEVQRHAFTDYFFQDLTMDEIAQNEGLAWEEIREQLHAAVRALYKYID